jgi:hypothetical protein
MKKLLIPLIPFFILSCASRPYIKQYNLSDGTNMYFISASTWNGDKIRVHVDLNFKDNAEIEVICNMSIRQKASLPRGISSIVLNADACEYPLSDIQILLVDSRKNTVRITSLLNHDNFLKIMKSKAVTLQLIISGVHYECTPSKEFLILKDEFQNNYFAMNELLN